MDRHDFALLVAKAGIIFVAGIFSLFIFLCLALTFLPPQLMPFGLSY